MQKLCTKCHLTNKGRLRNPSILFLLTGLLIGGGLHFINDDIFGSRILTILLSIFFLSVGSYFLFIYFLGLKSCPYCGKDGMIPLNSPDAKELIKKIKLEKGSMICSTCYNTIKTVQPRKLNVYVSMILLFFGTLGVITLLEDQITFSINYLEWIGYLVYLSFGIYGLVTYFITTSVCPYCDSKGTMIPLDTPKAQALIKEHKLTIPEEARQQASIPKTSQ